MQNLLVRGSHQTGRRNDLQPAVKRSIQKTFEKSTLTLGSGQAVDYLPRVAMFSDSPRYIDSPPTH
eukprot:2358896-Pyramimonas_sp.AAC.4